MFTIIKQYKKSFSMFLFSKLEGQNFGAPKKQEPQEEEIPKNFNPQKELKNLKENIEKKEKYNKKISETARKFGISIEELKNFLNIFDDKNNILLSLNNFLNIINNYEEEKDSKGLKKQTLNNLALLIKNHGLTKGDKKNYFNFSHSAGSILSEIVNINERKSIEKYKERIITEAKKENEERNKDIKKIEKFFPGIKINKESFDNLKGGETNNIRPEKMLLDIKDKIDSFLNLPNKDINKLKNIVTKKFNIISSYVKEINNEYSNNEISKTEFSSERFKIQAKFEEQFKFVNTELLPNIAFLNKFESRRKLFGRQINSKYDEVRKIWNNITIDDDGGLSGGMFDFFDPNLYVDNHYVKKEDAIDEIDILSEKDKEVKENAEYAFYALIAGQIAVETMGGLAGTVIGGGVDFYDVFSENEALIILGQKMGLIPKDFATEKLFIDNVLAGIGLLPGATQAIKGTKLAKFLSRKSLLELDKFFIQVDKVGQKMGLEKGHLNTWIRNFMEIDGKPSVNSVKKNSKLGDIERTDKAEKLLGGEKLSDIKKDAILKAHEVGKDREGASVFNYTKTEIREKAKILKDAGFDKKEIRVLMENGVVGEKNRFFGKIKNMFGGKKLELNKVYSEIEVSKLEVGQILQVKTESGSIYEFTVLEKNKGKVVVEWSGGKETLKSVKGYIYGDNIKAGEQLFIGRGHTSNIEEIKILGKEVDKKTLETENVKEFNKIESKSLKKQKINIPGINKKLLKGESIEINYTRPIEISLAGEKLILLKEGNNYILKDSNNNIHKIGNGIMIGRNPNVSGNSMTINNSYVSSQHLVININQDGKIQINDLESTNGTHIKEIGESKIIGKEKLDNVFKSKFEDFNKNMDDISSNFINILGEAYIPRHVINIDGKEFLLTDKMNLGRKSIIAYTKVNGSYEPRLFYFSNSGGNWHVSPGIRSKDLGFSKGEKWGLGYEKGTVLNEKLSQKLETIPNGQNKGSTEDLHSLGFTDSKYQKPTNEVNRINITEGNSNHSFADFEDKELNIQETKNLFSDIEILGLNMNFSKIKKGDNIKHKYLGVVNIDIAETKLDGKDVEILFAKSQKNPDLVWVEDIRYKDTEINSFGFSSEKIEGGLLTAKPIEYTSQIPKGFRNNNNLQKYGSVYTDIRELMQGNPLIKSYKRQLNKVY